MEQTFIDEKYLHEQIQSACELNNINIPMCHQILVAMETITPITDFSDYLDKLYQTVITYLKDEYCSRILVNSFYQLVLIKEAGGYPDFSIKSK